MSAIKKFFQMFLDPNGDTSSKRVFGAALIISGIVGAFTGMDSANVGILIGGGMGVFVAQAVSKT